MQASSTPPPASLLVVLVVLLATPVALHAARATPAAAGALFGGALLLGMAVPRSGVACVASPVQLGALVFLVATAVQGGGWARTWPAALAIGVLAVLALVCVALQFVVRRERE